MDPVNKVDALVFANVAMLSAIPAPSTTMMLYDCFALAIVRSTMAIETTSYVSKKRSSGCYENRMRPCNARSSFSERGSAQWSLEKFETMEKARVDLATCGYDFTVSQLVYALKTCGRICRGSEEYTMVTRTRFNFTMTLYPFFEIAQTSRSRFLLNCSTGFLDSPATDRLFGKLPFYSSPCRPSPGLDPRRKSCFEGHVLTKLTYIC
jgi:hypothetical protein